MTSNSFDPITQLFSELRLINEKIELLHKLMTSAHNYQLAKDKIKLGVKNDTTP